MQMVSVRIYVVHQDTKIQVVSVYVHLVSIQILQIKIVVLAVQHAQVEKLSMAQDVAVHVHLDSKQMQTASAQQFQHAHQDKFQLHQALVLVQALQLQQDQTAHVSVQQDKLMGQQDAAVQHPVHQQKYLTQ